MKKTILIVLCAAFMAPPVFAVDKEVIQLQQNVALLQGIVQELQRSFTEKMAVMQTLLGQSNDKFAGLIQNSNDLSARMAETQKNLQTSMANTGQKVDNLHSDIQGLQASLDELRARLDKVSDQVAKLSSAQQAIPSGGGSPTGFVPNGPAGFNDPGASAANSSAPSPDVLYNTALRDYTGGNYPLAAQEFTDYLRFFPNTTLASNAQFYIGDIYYQQGQFDKAIQEYDKTVEQYPNGNKTAQAQLKKGYAYLNLDQRAAGVRELKSLMDRFPNTPESALAKDRLASLAPEKPAPRPARKAVAR